MEKETIKKYIPKCILNLYYRLQYPMHVWPLVRYDAKRFIRFSGKNDSEESLAGLITNNMHSIEKGFTMPDFRYGFGQKRLEEVLDQCILYMKRYALEGSDYNKALIVAAAKTAYDYKKVHLEAETMIPLSLLNKIDTFLSYFPDLQTDSIQIETTKELFFSYRDADFKTFSNSRRSARNFTDEPIDVETMKKAIALAQNAPSACNRQSPRVYLVESRETIKEVFKYQGGNRGFGQTVDKLIVVCSYLGNYHDTERNCAYIDGGIFTMNLAYALHYYGVGACILNWSATKKRDKKVRKILSVRDSEVIVDLIACGNVPSEFKVCRSEKKELHHILTEVK